MESRKVKKVSATKARSATPGPKTSADYLVAEPVDGTARVGPAGLDRLSFDGYHLTWHGVGGKSWSAFSGQADEAAHEAVKDFGPTPQGLFAVEPANIEEFPASDDWGSHRVRIEPYAPTIERMKNCLKVIRTGMYIHGGSVAGTHGCIELNNVADEKEFFVKLQKYGARIELEVRYSGAREKKYEFASCPYP